ncbi:hypothetical protein [Helicobacter pylori]|uniref:hypothetical protein n=1 Tax=Helicobacter pylori TaxID=210 RepID=UPI0015E66409|nr:hypothetical protein [Helicobacter pylori]
MRQKNETETSFNQLNEITQITQALERSVQTNANANTSEIASQSAPKPKATAHAKNHALKPTKRAFSDRKITTIKDNSQANNKNLRAEPSDETLKQGLKNNQIKGGQQ